jgi:hypothetical protein
MKTTRILGLPADSHPIRVCDSAEQKTSKSKIKSKIRKMIRSKIRIKIRN